MLLGSLTLQTNDEAQSLQLADINKFEDGSGYFCVLVVRSRGFACERQFFFDHSFLLAFVVTLETMDRGHPAQAVLKGTWETDELRFAMNSKGHVVVSGEMSEHAELSQQLRFAFRTDQTVLRPLIRDIRTMLRLPGEE